MKIESKVPRTIMDAPASGIYPPYLEPSLRPLPKPPDNVSKKQEVESSKIEIEEDTPFQENIISECRLIDFSLTELIFSCRQTSFHQFQTWLLPGLRKC